MGTGSRGNGRRAQESGTGLIGCLVAGAEGTGQGELSGVGLHGGPPEPLIQDLQGAGRSRMAGELGRMPPLKNLQAG